MREDRPLSLKVADRTGVPHESPQVICLIDGRVAGHLSHYEVTGAGLSNLLPPPRR